jgi:acetyl esterase/lipase
MIRMLMGVSGLVPVPSDALVTPVTFQVRKRALRGILADFDALEDETRELSGEWVVGKRTWQRLQSEWKASKKAAESLGSGSKAYGSSKHPKRKERVILYLHGGGYLWSVAVTTRY